jgi:hypothetical protein
LLQIKEKCMLEFQQLIDFPNDFDKKGKRDRKIMARSWWHYWRSVGHVPKRRVESYYNNFIKQRLPFEIVISDKRTNSEGLQFADIIARPIGLSVLKPEQPNRAFTILRSKLYQDHESFVYPLKAKDPKVVLEVQTPVG